MNTPITFLIAEITPEAPLIDSIEVRKVLATNSLPKQMYSDILNYMLQESITLLSTKMFNQMQFKID